MEIRNKITLIFIALSGSLLFFIFIFIYYFSHLYNEYEFFQRLNERANIAAQAILEKDEMNAAIYTEIRNRHLQVLPNEKETVFEVDISDRTILKGPKNQFPELFFQRVFSKGYSQLKMDDLYYAGLLYSDNEGNFIVTVAAKDLYGAAEMRHLFNILLVCYLAGLVLIYFIGKFYAGRVLSPIATITGKANEISANKLHLRLETGRSKDELNELATTINHMLDRLENAFETQNNFVNNASHELRNPLTAILGETEIALSKRRSKEDYEASLRTIQMEAQRLDLLIKSLLELAQTGLEAERLTLAPVRMDELLIEIKQNLDITNPDNQAVLDFNQLPRQSDRLILHGNQNLLSVALGNILDNACKFSGNQEVVVKIKAPKDALEITIADHGIGIPNKELNHISQPFYRAANARGFKGFGVGLPLARKIIDLHGGKMTIDSLIRQGTTVTISFQTDQKTKLSKAKNRLL